VPTSPILFHAPVSLIFPNCSACCHSILTHVHAEIFLTSVLTKWHWDGDSANLRNERPQMKLYIKNMVCNRCKMVVKDQLIKIGLHPILVELGEVTIAQEINAKQKSTLNNILMTFGFLLIDDKKSRIIEKIKNTIINHVHYSDEQLKTNFSEYISNQLHHNYNYLSNLFSDVEGTTIEQYFISQKIERVKELLVYDELSVSEIALQMNYNSVSHLSKQFKKVTGFTPTYYKKLKERKRTPIEEL
jgi:AraC-like DNA-binding protein